MNLYDMTFRIPVGQAFSTLVELLDKRLESVFDFITYFLNTAVKGLEDALQMIPIPVMIILLVLLAWRISGRGVAVFTLVGFILIAGMDLWVETMQTLSLVFISAIITLGVGIPLGIWASRSDLLDKLLRPVLDFMQTLPAFVYLIPAILFFHIGRVPGVISTVIFAMPPAIRLTNLGIRQVPADVVEAAHAFGSTDNQLLVKVQLPMALPTIMAGINQTIMLSLSMVVIASMVGAPGLGKEVLYGVTQLDIATGFEGGLAVVLVAMFLDRVTESLGKGNQDNKNNQ
ncbi:MAG: glycine betaine/proline transport system permease protein [Clostridia bacterium]|nr:glycine betaine/proline transport system permease protein [Clostridia bacterium]